MATNKRLVFFFEDDPLFRNMCVKLSQFLPDIKVVPFEKPSKAMDKLNNGDELPALFLIDERYENLADGEVPETGTEFARYLMGNERLAHIPRVAITGYAGVMIHSREAQEVFNAIKSKDFYFSPEMLSELVSSYID